MDSFQITMVVIGCVCAVGSVVCFVYGARFWRRQTVLEDTPIISVARAAQMSNPAGSMNVEIAGHPEVYEPLESPVTKIPCLYYRVKVEELRYSGEYSSWTTVVDDRKEVPFLVSDVSGGVWINPKGAEFVAKKTVNKSPGAGGGPGLQVGGSLFGSLLGSIGNRVRTTEWVIPIDDDVCVMGNSYRTDKGVVLGKGQGHFVVSSRQEEELIQHYWYKAIGLFTGGVFLAIGGMASVLYGILAGKH